MLGGSNGLNGIKRLYDAGQLDQTAPLSLNTPSVPLHSSVSISSSNILTMKNLAVIAALTSVVTVMAAPIPGSAGSIRTDCLLGGRSFASSSQYPAYKRAELLRAEDVDVDSVSVVLIIIVQVEIQIQESNLIHTRKMAWTLLTRYHN